MTTILIVEDNAAHMRLAAKLLEVAGYAVLQAADAVSGMALAGERRPDLVLMDVHLPGMGGFEATRALKAAEATRGIPVIAMSSYLAEHPERGAREAGAAAFVAKPFHHAELLGAIARVLAAAGRD